jgi:hypothetical protein
LSLGIDMATLTLALDLEGIFISNALSPFSYPGLMRLLCQCEGLFGRNNICIFTTVDEKRFREIAKRLVLDGRAPE